MTIVVGTAGHIDHGKTRLLRALTGIDADRLPEEQARGLTIDVGYAHLALADGSAIDFIDVPGHDRLVGNMLVGVSEIDAALLVIAADDGPRAQTIEHLELLDGLAIRDGLAVITKTDTVPADQTAAVVAAARTLLAQTSLANVAVLAVSSTTGAGLADVRAALLAVRDRVEARALLGGVRLNDGSSRLAIDRVFTIRGRGTVVTGTLRGRPIGRGDRLRVVPGEAGETIRVREIQVHNQTLDRAGPGRVALNLSGSRTVDRLKRGIVLTTDPATVASDRILVALQGPAPTANNRLGRPLPPDRTAVTVHLGTAHVAASIGRSGRDAHDLGSGAGSAILRLARPMAVAPGDRFIIRRPSPAATLGAGRILDPFPPRGIARQRATPNRIGALAAADSGSPSWSMARLDLHGAVGGPHPRLALDVATGIDEALLAMVAERGEVGVAELVRLGGRELRRQVGSIGPGERSGSAGQTERMARDDLVGARLTALVTIHKLERAADRVRIAGERPPSPSPELVAAMDRLVALLATVSPPSLAAAATATGCPPHGVRALEQSNRIVRLADDLAWAFPIYRELAGRALAMAAAGPLTPAAYRDATGTSRKYVMAILEDLDRRAILRRTPEGHVPGPRAPALRPRIGGPAT